VGNTVRCRKAQACSMLGTVLLASLHGAAVADTSAFTITDDATLNSIVSQARTEFLATRPFTQFNRLNCTLLVPNTNGTWRRGSYGQTTLSYPASTVKLGYLAAAMYWCRINGRTYNSLDSSVGPMIRVSDNYQTGVVVDTITGQPNIAGVTSTADSRYAPFYNKRLFTENYLNGRGLLETMTAMHKTYPTNNPYEGAEVVAINTRGGNRWNPKLAASLMLEINRGAIESGANSYMRGLLTQNRFSGYGPLGWGLPPGTTYEAKIGNAYDDLNDIAYIKLPNGKEMILAVYSNGYYGEQAWAAPYDTSGLGMFAEILIDKLGYQAGNPARLIKDNTAATYLGSWSTGTGARDKYGADYRFNTGGTGADKATWNLAVPETGLYEVCVLYSQGTNRATDAPYTVNHAGGATLVRVNQQRAGGRWIRLGDFNFNAGTGSVVLTDAIANASQVVMADAVKVTKHPADIVVDNANAGFAASASWSTGTGATDKYGSDYRFRSTQAISDSATFTYSVPTAGNYEIYAWWPAGTNRSQTAPFVVSHSTGSITVQRNQQANGGTWNSLGTFALNAGTNTVKLSCWTATGFVVMADAIRVVRR